MNIRDETLIHLSREQVVIRAAIQWLMAREAKLSGNIDATLRDASEKIGKIIADAHPDEQTRGPFQESLDQLIAKGRLQAGL
jgi:hypothetical protein